MLGKRNPMLACLRHRAARTAGSDLCLQRARLLHPPTYTRHRLQSLISFPFPAATTIHQRHFSLASLLPRSPVTVPTPETLASVHRLEADADASPKDIERHVLLYQALLRTKVKQGSERVMARWERLVQFVSL